MHEVFRVLNYEHIRNLRENFDRFKERQENHLYTLDADHDFHMAMFAPLGNNTLITLLEAIWQVDAIFRPEEKLLFKPETIAEHEAILRALEEHNEEAFFAAMLSHFSMGKYAPAAGKPSLHISAAGLSSYYKLHPSTQRGQPPFAASNHQGGISREQFHEISRCVPRVLRLL